MPRQTKLYQWIAETCEALEHVRASDNGWREIYQSRLDAIAKNWLPSGSGFDCGTKIEGMKNGVLILTTDFHHMDENGFYDGWTNHIIHIKPHLAYGFTMTISGPDRNGWKEFALDIFDHDLRLDVIKTDEGWQIGDVRIERQYP